MKRKITEEFGERVRMTEELKRLLRGNCHHHELAEARECYECSSAHVIEFGDCIGLVEDLVQPNCPEVNVRWLPSRLRYGYDPKYLEEA
jgi:hypothetical protein